MIGRRLLTTASLLLLALPVGAGADPTNPAADCSARAPFRADIRRDLATRYPGRRFTAAVYDQRGCTYELNPDLRLTTASVVKLEIMAAVLLRAQRAGRGLTSWERSQIWPMITRSANAPASALFSSLGGAAAMERADDDFGLRDTTHPGGTWGLTTTSAADQVLLLREVVAGEFGPLSDPYRAEARRFLTNVVASQRWGASAAIPAEWPVAQKNGFAPSRCCGWRLNSVGWIDRPGGPGWAIAVLSDGWPDSASGTIAVNELSRAINTALLAAPIGHQDTVRAVERGVIEVAGWAAERDVEAQIDVHIYVDGRGAAASPAALDRGDVGAHGYSVTINVGEGTRRVCSYAINAGPAAPNSLLGCADVVV